VPPPLFVLTADSEDELHAFAARLGIRRDPGTPATVAGFVQQTGARQYLLTEGERDQAAGLGAQAIPARKAGKLERQRAAARSPERGA
jgi:hypothetical protein